MCPGRHGSIGLFMPFRKASYVMGSSDQTSDGLQYSRLWVRTAFSFVLNQFPIEERLCLTRRLRSTAVQSPASS